MACTTVTRQLPCFPSYADALAYFDMQKPLRGQTCVPMVARKYWKEFNAAKAENGDIQMYEGHPAYVKEPRFTYHPDNTVTITARDSRLMWSSTMTYMSMVIPNFAAFRRDNKTIMRMESGEYVLNLSGPIRLRLVNGKAELHEETIIEPQVRRVLDRKAFNKVRPKYKPFLEYFEVFWSLYRDDYGRISMEFIRSVNPSGPMKVKTGEEANILMCSENLEDHYRACVYFALDIGYWGANKSDMQRRIKKIMVYHNEGVLIEETVPPGTVKKDLW